MTRWTAAACVLALLALVLATAALWKTHQLASHKHSEPRVPRCAGAEKDYSLVIADARRSREEAARAVELAALDSTPKTKYPAAYKAFHAYFSAHYDPLNPRSAPWSAAKNAADAILEDAANAVLTARGINGLVTWANYDKLAEYTNYGHGPDFFVGEAVDAVKKHIVSAYPAAVAVRLAARDAERAASACVVLAECHKRRGEFACYSNGEYRP